MTTGQHTDSAVMASDRAELERRIDNGETSIPRHQMHPDVRLAGQVHIAKGNATREHRRLQETHVVVGDHAPEPRNDRCRFGVIPVCQGHGRTCSCEPHLDKAWREIEDIHNAS